MTLSNLNKTFIKFAIIVTLLALSAWVITGCEDYGQFPTPQPSEEKPEKTPPTSVKTEDGAILSVYDYLLGKAEGYKAKASEIQEQGGYSFSNILYE